MTELLKNGVDILDVVKPVEDVIWLAVLGAFLCVVAAIGIAVAIVAGICPGIRDRNMSKIIVGFVLLIGALLIGYCAVASGLCTVTVTNSEEVQYLLYVPDEIFQSEDTKYMFDSCFSVIKQEGTVYLVALRTQNNQPIFEEANTTS